MITGALDVGGSHVTAALVEGTTIIRRQWRPLDGDATAETLLADLRAAIGSCDAPVGTVWGIAMPGPFDYRRGVGQFTGVGKFDALRGVDVGAALGVSAVFGNDADVAAYGEWVAGASRGVGRCVGLTLGTGVGSGWLVDGRPVIDGPTVPPGGEAHRLRIGDQALEEVMSRRAIRRAYDPRGGATDVDEIAARARSGERKAQDVLHAAITGLGAALTPWLERFGAELVVIGGAMSASWDVLGSSFRVGAAVRVAELLHDGALIGAASLAREPRYWYT